MSVHAFLRLNQAFWGSLSKAAGIIDVSDDTILRRAVEFDGDVDEIEQHPCPEGKIRFKKLKLGKGTRQECRYYLPDLSKWLNKTNLLRLVDLRSIPVPDTYIDSGALLVVIHC
jgi:hypothetical protein